MRPVMADAAVVTCINCGRKNRIARGAEGIPRCGVCHQALPWIVDADDTTIDAELRTTLPVLADFWAPWCAPCLAISAGVKKLADEYAGRLKVVKVNVDASPASARRYGAQSIPLLIIFRDGEEVSRRVGAIPAVPMRKWLGQFLSEQPA
ncbi:MAG: thioredoxin [Solirubrobacterales bacterium]|nr:thioredoxin [Solirubrobacterales bacterium]